MTNVQHKLIQDVKDQGEKISILETKYNATEGLFNVINKAILQNADGIESNIEDISFNRSDINDLKNEVSLLTKLLLATATLTIINFIMLVVIATNL